MKGKKERLDVLLVQRGLIETREKAKRAIMAGLVYSNEVRLDKPGEKVPVDIPLAIKGDVLPYVSRGGLKLEKALRTWSAPALSRETERLQSAILMSRQKQNLEPSIAFQTLMAIAIQSSR